MYGTIYLSPLIIIRKGDSIKCVLDARHLNSNTEQSDESGPIEPLAPQLARGNKKYKCAIDLMYAYAHTPLDEETIKLTSFSSGDKRFAFIRGIYGFQRTPKFLYKTNVHLLQNSYRNKVLPLSTSMTFYFYQTLKNICFN